MTNQPKIMISLKVPADLTARLRQIAATEHNGISAVCRRLLSEGVQREAATSQAQGA